MAKLAGAALLAAGLLVPHAAPATGAPATEPRIVLVSTLAPKLPAVVQLRRSVKSYPWISHDGRYLAYYGSDEGGGLSYITDLARGTTQPLHGLPPGLVPSQFSMDGDAKRIAAVASVPFDPRPTLIGDPPQQQQVMVWDRVTGISTAVPVPPCPNGCTWYLNQPTLSDDGGVVVFWADGPADVGGLFAYDLDNATLEQVAPEVAVGVNGDFDLSTDGRFVVTSSPYPEHVPLLFDRVTGQLTRFDGHRSSSVSISGDGETIAYDFFTVGFTSVRVIDAASGAWADVAIAPDGTRHVELSRTGRFVAYLEKVPRGMGTTVRVVDRDDGSTWSPEEHGTRPDLYVQQNAAGPLSFSRNERYIAFGSELSNVVAGVESEVHCVSPPSFGCDYTTYLYRGRLSP
jgi:hypothetical protein